MGKSRLNRRELFARAAQTLAAAGLAPLAVAAEAQTESTAASADAWKPQFFTLEQNDALAALGERMVPGSAAAQCSRFIDLMMTVESAAARSQLLDALAAFDREARQRHAESFRALPAEQQDAVLLLASARKSLLHPQFQTVKEWTTAAFWSSREGMRALGGTGRIAWGRYTAACEAGGGAEHGR